MRSPGNSPFELPDDARGYPAAVESLTHLLLLEPPRDRTTAALGAEARP